MAATIQKIKPTGIRASWLRAREYVKDKGGLPSHVLHDDLLVRAWPALPQAQRELFESYYPAWAREVLVYPKTNKRFKRGNDILDPHQDNSGRVWVFPAFAVPYEAFEQKNVVLLVDPEEIELTRTRVVVLADPESVIALSTAVWKIGGSGMVDEDTRIPLEVDRGLFKRLKEHQKRWLWRMDGFGVRPIHRNVNVFNGGRDIFGGGSYDLEFGAGHADTEESLLVNGVNRSELETMVHAAHASISSALRHVPSETLADATELVSRLDSALK